MIRRPTTPFPLVASGDLRHVQLVHHVGYEVGQMVVRQPLLQRRWQQQTAARVRREGRSCSSTTPCCWTGPIIPPSTRQPCFSDGLLGDAGPHVAVSIFVGQRRLITNVYIDGFNLYYRALQDTPFRWLDLRKLAEPLFPQDAIKPDLLFHGPARCPPRQSQSAPSSAHLPASAGDPAGIRRLLRRLPVPAGRAIAGTADSRPRPWSGARWPRGGS